MRASEKERKKDMKDRDQRFRDKDPKEKELSPEGQRALKSWKRTQWCLRIGVGVIVLAVLLFSFGPSCVYRYGQSQFDRGNYAKAASAFQWLETTAGTFRVRGKPGGRYKDSSAKANECHYILGNESFAKGNYSEAADYFTRAYGYKDTMDKERQCHYRMGLALMEQGAYAEAMVEFLYADGYADSNALYVECENLIPAD